MPLVLGRAGEIGHWLHGRARRFGERVERTRILRAGAGELASLDTAGHLVDRAHDDGRRADEPAVADRRDRSDADTRTLEYLELHVADAGLGTGERHLDCDDDFLGADG